MSNFTIEAVIREDQGKGASRRLRNEGLVPAVVYGGAKNKKPLSLSLINKDFVKLTNNDNFFSSIITLMVDGKEEKVIIKDLQRHPAKPLLLHADFQRITKSNKISIKVPISFINFEQSVVAKAAAKFAVEANVVEVICMADKLPESVTVDLSNVEIGQVLHLSDISVPAGVKVSALRRGEDHNQSIGYVYSPRGATAE
ncbi:MAG: 50S ribosomal protein L25/general stress protein Ctc [Osedax symbiont Rs2]|nr:MAG: 50S ribosomal protein L25/general stress protein Ctc [Osedax symbiont Rs2]